MLFAMSLQINGKDTTLDLKYKKKHVKMGKLFNLPNLLTASNMLSGIIAVLFSTTGNFTLACSFIFLGAIFDFFDGFLARLLKQQGELGKQLDSLADMITFGLAPGVFMLVLLLHLSDLPALQDHTNWRQTIFSEWMQQLTTKEAYFLPLFALIIPFFSLFRLAKFNIDTRQSTSFIGLPTPANTIFFTSFPLIYSFSSGASGVEKTMIDFFFQIPVICVFILGMSLMLIAEIPLFALKFKDFKWAGNEIRFSFLISSLILIPLLWLWSIPIIVLLYLILSIVEHFIIKNKQHEIQS